MKTAILRADGFSFQEEPVPVCGKNEVLVKSAGCGICEGDVFRYVTRNDGPRDDKGIMLGHEGSGVVVEVGENVTEFKAGDKVTALGGAYGEYFVALPGQLAIVPPEIDVCSALGEPIACCMAGARRFGVELGDRVAMIGAGYMGLNCMQLAKLRGASEIVVFDLLDWRLDYARKLGADRTVNSQGKKPADLLAELGEFDVVMEATGVQGAVDLGTALVKQHGVLNLIGYHQSNNGMRQLDMKTWNFKAITVVNCHIRNEAQKLSDMKAALKLVAGGKLNAEALITDYRFDDINQAFLDLKSRKPGLFKANLIF